MPVTLHPGPGHRLGLILPSLLLSAESGALLQCPQPQHPLLVFRLPSHSDRLHGHSLGQLLTTLCVLEVEELQWVPSPRVCHKGGPSERSEEESLGPRGVGLALAHLPRQRGRQRGLGEMTPSLPPSRKVVSDCPWQSRLHGLGELPGAQRAGADVMCLQRRAWAGAPGLRDFTCHRCQPALPAHTWTLPRVGRRTEPRNWSCSLRPVRREKSTGPQEP